MKSSFTLSKITFKSGDATCVGDLYLPDQSTGKLPCLVMGHGFSGTKDFGIPAYAGQYASNGFAVLAFDYRNFGESEGEPRQVINIAQQREDFHAAIQAARSMELIDPTRIAIWGSSLGGGHVIQVAVTDQKIAAAILQVPFIDAFNGAGNEKAPARVQFKLLWAALSDLLRGWLGLSPYYVPVVGAPGSFATMTEPEAMPVVNTLIAEGSKWQNAFAPRIAFSMPHYKEGTIEQLTIPILLCVADNDTQASPEFAIKTVEKAPRGEILRYPVGHFSLYVGEMRDRAIADQIEFLKRHLMSNTA